MNTIYSIQQLYPAPGFRVVRCYIVSDGAIPGEEVGFEELPVIGWAVLRDAEPTTPRDRYDLITDDRLELYVWEAGDGEAMSLRDVRLGNEDDGIFVMHPGQELTDVSKRCFENATRDRMASNERDRQRNRQICELYDQGKRTVPDIKNALLARGVKAADLTIKSAVKRHLQLTTH